ncbi:MAG: phosphoenolpyruvate synthase [Caldilineaceae bacterium]
MVATLPASPVTAPLSAIDDRPLVLPFTDINAHDLPLVGGKGANLGEMTQAGFPVPPGFCVTTVGFQRFMANCPAADELYATLERVRADDLNQARAVGEEVRSRLAAVPIPAEVRAAILAIWQEQGEEYAYAVRSSATAEDLPDASFAGQQDTYLNIRGAEHLLENVKRCWISLFTDRAILYRTQNGFDHRDVLLSVVVQRMVMPEVSGILFTADPVSGHRQIATIDASYGLGEALVSGIVSADLYKVDKRTQQELDAVIADKQLAIRPLPEGGTVQVKLEEPERSARVLTPAQTVALATLGSRIEAHYGKPQDIEWALAGGELYVVQSRPITSLYPIPQPSLARETPHVFVSFSHAQVMTDPMPPLARTLWRVTFPFGKPPDTETEYNPYLASAGGRLYIDPTPMLQRAFPRRVLPKLLENADPLIAQTVREVMARPEFQSRTNDDQDKATIRGMAQWFRPVITGVLTNLLWRQPEGRAEAASHWLDRYEAEVAARLHAAEAGAPRIAVACQVLGHLMAEVVDHMLPAVASGILARALLIALLKERADPEDLNAILRGLTGNVTTEMDLRVGDLADVARQSPAVVAHLTNEPATTVLSTLAEVAGGPAFLTALDEFLTDYGMRGPSEIDISRPRWRDDPTPLLQVIIGNLQHSASGSHRQHHAALAREGEAAAERLVTAARTGWLGPMRSRFVNRLTRVVRNLLPLREHPKFLLIRVIGEVRTVVLEAAAALVKQGRLEQVEDVWYLELLELADVLRNRADDPRPRVAQRKTEHVRAWSLTPPRVITSDGEIPIVHLTRDDLPAGALPGNPVSGGVVEGIARVVTDPTREVLAPGEILVAPFTDPGWTPLFINAAGLVMEVGGLMTHGSVVAREYGIPAVVGVLEATQRIQSGQRIRVHGDQGYVEILDEA